MKRVLVVLIILILNLIGTANCDFNKKKIAFHFFKKNARILELVGNLGKESRVVYLPMYKMSVNEWTLSISLTPGFYYYKYRIDRMHWRKAPFITEKIDVSDGPLTGEFTLLKIFPDKYEEFIEMADKFLLDNNYEWAKEVLIKASKEFQYKTEVYKKLGNIYKSMLKYEKAADIYSEGVEKNPYDLELCYLLVLTYEQLYEQTNNLNYRKRARNLWVRLLESKEYMKEAKKKLNKYAKED